MTMDLIKPSVHQPYVSLHLFRAPIEISVTLQICESSCSWRHSWKTTLKTICKKKYKHYKYFLLYLLTNIATNVLLCMGVQLCLVKGNFLVAVQKFLNFCDSLNLS